MVEVFRTDVKDLDQARMLVHHIHESFGHYQVNFDLADCDKILRVKCDDGSVEPENVIELLKDFGFNAEVLPDSPAVETRMSRMMRQCGALYFFQAYHAQ